MLPYVLERQWLWPHTKSPNSRVSIIKPKSLVPSFSPIAPISRISGWRFTGELPRVPCLEAPRTPGPLERISEVSQEAGDVRTTFPRPHSPALRAQRPFQIALLHPGGCLGARLEESLRVPAHALRWLSPSSRCGLRLGSVLFLLRRAQKLLAYVPITRAYCLQLSISVLGGEVPHGAQMGREEDRVSGAQTQSAICCSLSSEFRRAGHRTTDTGRRHCAESLPFRAISITPLRKKSQVPI